MTLQQPCMAQGDSSSSSGIVSTTTTSSEETTTPALDRKRQQLLETSMAFFDRKLDRCLDIVFSEPMKKVGGKRARAAVDSDHDSGVEEDWGVAGCGTTSTTAAKEKNKSAKKRAKRELPTASSGRAQTITPAPSSTTDGDDVATTAKFACPFYASNPAKYRTVRTCCGPGWPTAHRVKEHIYRSHCLKHTCPRCCESFKSDEELKHHQRLDEPCKKTSRAVDNSNNNNVITDKQEKLIRMRAKTNQPEEERWREMYKIIFPDARTIPSPYHQSTSTSQGANVKPEHEKQRTVDNAPAYTPSSSASTSRSVTPATASSSSLASNNNRGVRHRTGGGGGLESIQFRGEAELIQCKNYIHRNISRAVRPIIEKEVDNRLRMVSHAMAQKATDICKEVFTKMFRTWQFGSEQRSRQQTPSSSRSPAQTQTPDYQEDEEEQECLPAQTPSYTQAPAVNGGYYHPEVNQGPSMGPGPIDLNYEQFLPDPPAILGDMFNSDGGFDLESILKDIECNTGVDDYSYMGTSASDSAYFTNTATESGLSMGSFGESSSSGWS
ncbi:hypothetical protein V8F20_002757 [Naviculisporaceae sp. PSN 640]